MAYKYVFKFKIQGIEYKDLSSGEKLRFDLVISKFFNSLLTIPVNCYFADDTTVLDEDITLPNQGFITQVWPHELELQKT